MTGPSASDHLDLDALADVLAGERTGERHLRGCAQCSERLAELAGAEVAVVASLATLPAPALPDGLSDRLADALRAEAARDPRTTSTRTSPVTRLRPRRRAPAWLPAAAAAVALVVAGGSVLGVLQGRGPQSGTTDASSESAAGGQAAPEGMADLPALSQVSGVDYADEAQRDAGLTSLLAAADTAVPEPEVAVPSSARSGSAATAPPPPAPALGAGPVADPVLDRLRDPSALAQCLAALRRDGAPAAAPLALDYAAYGGVPALAVVSPDPDPAFVVLTVVGPGCSAADPDTRLRTRVARP